MAHLRKLKMKRAFARQTDMKTEVDEHTIMWAFCMIIDKLPNIRLDEASAEPLSEEFALLKERLDISPVQAVILAIFIEENSTMNYARLASFVGVSTIRMMLYANEINDLLNRHLIYSESSPFCPDQYGVPQDAVAAFLRNEIYVPPMQKKMMLDEFIETADAFIDAAVANSSDKETLCRDVSEMVCVNSDLSLCQKVSDFDKEEQLLFLCCCFRYILGGKRRTEWMLFNNVFEPRILKYFEVSFSNGDNELMKSNLLEYGGTSDFIDRTQISLTDELVDELDMELNLDWQNLDVQSPLLTSCDTVVAKEMFYNADEEEQLLRLADLLQPLNFSNVRQRLEDAGLRRGFACLFYGGPGTGKTETAMQVAKATGRDFMRVDISSIRSKWVGDSEKNIKNIFSAYYRLWRRGNPIPILLFNEADALFGRRNGDAERSIDKMENSLQNILLEELERFEGILIATTNLTSNFDPAFERRFLYKIRFDKPDVGAQTRIWQSMIEHIEEGDARTLAQRYDLSGGQIENVARKHIVDCILYNKSISLKRLEDYCRQELLSNSSMHNRTAIGFRHLQR